MTTNSEEKRMSLIQIYSDFHKDAYGVRPRGVNYSEFTLEELEADFASFQSLCESNDREEEARSNYAIAEFEKRVQSVIDMGAGDRKTALRWIMDSYDGGDMMYGMEGFVSYEMGLGVNDYAKELAVELEPLAQGAMDAFYAERYADVA
jgi:hypothetical protein